VRLRDGKCECSHCGTVLELPLDEAPRVVIQAASGKPNVRILILKGEEIHRCIVDDLPTSLSHPRAGCGRAHIALTSVDIVPTIAQ
jgi:hypothetical protein